MDWYPWFPELYRDDTEHLTLEQDAAYRRLIDHYMISRRPIPAAPQALARIVGVGVEKWVEIAPAILPFFRPRGDLLTLKRCEILLRKQDAKSKFWSERAKKAALVRWNNDKDVDATSMLGSMPGTMLGSMLEVERDKKVSKEESISRPSVARPSHPDCQAALEAWNVTAEKAGLPRAQRLTEPRARKLAARLAECGGLAGWQAALTKLESSSFCTGRRTSWRADFDFMLQQKSFTKLMEGAYDDQPTHTANGNGHFNGRGPNHGGTRSVVQIAADLVTRLEKKGSHN